jgi:hypothetical protein
MFLFENIPLPPAPLLLIWIQLYPVPGPFLPDPEFSSRIRFQQFITVLDLVSQVRDVVLMKVYLDLENSRGSGFWNGGYMSKGREMGRAVYEQPGNEVDGSYHSKEGSK